MMRILLVDDSADLLDIYSLLLEREGFSVTCASDGEEAMAWLASGMRPDLILTDVSMPRMDGLELCRRLHLNERLRDIPVLVHSSDSGVRTPYGEVYIRKACELSELLDLIQRLTRGIRGQPQLASVA
jgi:CheY-like chemotaxis protein